MKNPSSLAARRSSFHRAVRRAAALATLAAVALAAVATARAGSGFDARARARAARLARRARTAQAIVNAQDFRAGFQVPVASAYTPAAVTSAWKTATSGQWNAAANWTNAPAQGSYPNDGNGGAATYDAVINVAGPAYTVTSDQNETVEHLTLNSTAATLALTGGTFTANTGIDLTAGNLLLNGGTISNTTINLTAGTLSFNGSGNALNNVALNADLTLSASFSAVRVGAGTTFGTVHLANSYTGVGFAPGQTLGGAILLEGANGGLRTVELNGTAGSFTVGSTGVIRTTPGFAGSGQVGGGYNYGGAMSLTNQGLISSQTSGQTLNLNPASLSNAGTLEATNGGTLNVTNGYTQTAGTTRVGAKSTLSGGTITLNGGNLEGSGTVSNTVVAAAATLAPGGTGAAGALTLSGGLTLTNATALQIEIGGAASGTDYDLLADSSVLALRGRLTLGLLNNFYPAAGNTFTVLTTPAALTGAFANVASGSRLFTADGLSSFQVNYGSGSAFNADNVVLSNFVTSVPEPVDAMRLVGAGLTLLGLCKVLRSRRSLV